MTVLEAFEKIDNGNPSEVDEGNPSEVNLMIWRGHSE
jgi:hypothetical protein